MNKPLTVIYFAWLRDRTRSAQEEVSLPDGVETVGDLMDYLSAQDANLAAAFSNRTIVRCAVNQEFADATSRVQPGDEVAFFPPVTGG